MSQQHNKSGGVNIFKSKTIFIYNYYIYLFLNLFIYDKILFLKFRNIFFGLTLFHIWENIVPECMEYGPWICVDMLSQTGEFCFDEI